MHTHQYDLSTQTQPNPSPATLPKIDVMSQLRLSQEVTAPDIQSSDGLISIGSGNNSQAEPVILNLIDPNSTVPLLNLAPERSDKKPAHHHESQLKAAIVSPSVNDSDTTGLNARSSQSNFQSNPPKNDSRVPSGDDSRPTKDTSDHTSPKAPTYSSVIRGGESLNKHWPKLPSSSSSVHHHPLELRVIHRQKTTPQ